VRYPFWFGPSGVQVAGWLHHHSSGRAHKNGVLICPPFGFEYIHSHRSLVHLADKLATAGFVVLRLDYPGTGDSAGDEGASDLVAAWLGSVGDGLDLLERLTGGPATVVGLRLGALLGVVAASQRPVHGVVAWAPVVSGKRYVRELHALHRVAATDSSSSGFLEAGGFRISDSTAASLTSLDLASAAPDVVGEALVVDRTDQPLGAKLPGEAQFGVIVTHLEQQDYPDMMAEPQYTIVPHELLSEIVDWALRTTHGDAVPLDSSALEHMRSRRTTPVDGDEIHETMCLLAEETGKRLYGVLCTQPGSTPSPTAVLLPNAGSVHHVGPNRFYVELARELARAGIPSLRFDLRNLGDSRIGSSPAENHPYPITAVEDIRHAVRWLTTAKGYESCVVAGLCSGAHAAFHAASQIEEPAVSGVVSINPLTFHFEQGMSLDTPQSHQTTRDAHYYQQALTDPARWLKLLRGESEVLYILRFMGRRLSQLVADRTRWSMHALGLLRHGPLRDDLQSIDGFGRTIHFVFSSTDPGAEILRRGAGSSLKWLTRKGTAKTSTVLDADHTFSKKEHRDAAIALVVDQLRPRLEAASCLELEGGPNLWPSILPSWRALLEQTGETSPFLSETWMESWIRTFGARLGTRGLVWSDTDGVPVGCAVISMGRGSVGRFSVSQAHLNGSGVTGVGCEHNDVLALPGYRATIVRDLIARVKSLGADEIFLDGVRERLFYDFVAQSPGLKRTGLVSESPFVPLQQIRESGGDYVSSLSSSTRSQIRRSIREYTRRFGECKVTVALDSDEALRWYQEMLTLHDERWDGNGSTSGFGLEARRFHGDLIRRVLDDETVGDLSVDLTRISFGDQTIGLLYTLVYRRHVYFFQGGLRYNVDAKLKPGLVSHALAIGRYLDLGSLEYDLMGGEPEPVRYKRSLASGRRHLTWTSIALPTPRSKILHGLRRGKRWLWPVRVRERP
jgi:pimeloyl-ACP methyl ester carboxylesterase